MHGTVSYIFGIPAIYFWLSNLVMFRYVIKEVKPAIGIYISVKANNVS